MENQPNKSASSLPELWSTDLFMPQYKHGKIGSWMIRPGGQLIHDWGYFSGSCLVAMQPALARKSGDAKAADPNQWETWMSLTPHEIESQELACQYAYGHTVVMGLGMGWVAANIALNSQVTQVTVVELDLEVISLFQESGAFDSLPESARNKISIVNSNAMEWKPSKEISVQFLFADIWLHLAEKETLNQVRQMQLNVHAETIYYWGQEIAIYNAVSKCEHMNKDSLTMAIKEQIQLPLLIPSDRDYAKMIDQVIKNREARKLPIYIEIE